MKFNFPTFLLGFLIGGILGILILNYIIKKDSNFYPKSTEVLDSKIDSVIIVKDSLIQKIDTVTKQIEKVKVQYEKDINTIRYNSNDKNLEFFSDYIRENCWRFCDSIN